MLLAIVKKFSFGLGEEKTSDLADAIPEAESPLTSVWETLRVSMVTSSLISTSITVAGQRRLTPFSDFPTLNYNVR
jgi:hypothetical protein